MNREAHVRFYESAGVKLPRATHPKKRICCAGLTGRHDAILEGVAPALPRRVTAPDKPGG